MARKSAKAPTAALYRVVLEARGDDRPALPPGGLLAPPAPAVSALAAPAAASSTAVAPDYRAGRVHIEWMDASPTTGHGPPDGVAAKSAAASDAADAAEPAQVRPHIRHTLLRTGRS